MASKSNAKIASTSPLVTQTPPVAQAQRVVNPSPPQKNVYKVGSKAVLMPKRVGTITELTNSDTGSGAISATIKIDNDGSLVKATLNPSDDYWYPPKKDCNPILPRCPWGHRDAGASTTPRNGRGSETCSAGSVGVAASACGCL